MQKKINNVEAKVSNKAKIAKFIYKKNETSKQEIAQVLGLSMPTVLQNVKELVENGIVTESGKYQSTGGRKAKVLSIVEDFKYSIGLDVTKNHISFVLLNIRGNIIEKERIRYSYEDSIEYYEVLGTQLESFISKCNVQENQIIGVGISIPGIIDEENLILIRSHILDVSNISLKKFSQFIKYYTCFENDANSAASAEFSLNNKEAIYLSLSNTVGGAIYMNESIYMGDNFKSAEFGHMIIESKGKTCYCGKRGCIDAYCSALVLAEYCNNDLELFFEEVEKGNEKLRKVWLEYLDYLSIAVTNLRMVFDCEIIIGGYICEYLENYMLEFNKRISKNNNFDIDTTYISTGKYKKEASAIGVAMEFINQFFDILS